jgi:hypothetical protein
VDERYRQLSQDVAYTMLGFAVIGVQRLQVERRSLEARLREACDSGSLATLVDDVVAQVIPVGQELAHAFGLLPDSPDTD